MQAKLAALEQEYQRRDLVAFRPGDTVAVDVLITEGDRTRVQTFEGLVIRRRGGGVRETVTVRKLSFGIGVERIFPLHSPFVKEIRLVKQGKARRAHLSYVRKTR